ncbi:MAG: hypothetical protein N3A61_00120, partial [Ignavibacteria bacterium]|nr:hypothetical protein [Ignavibacteria bacterium]
DVPFFIWKKPSLVTGRGENIEPLLNFNLDYHILIIFPKIKISTSWAYSKIKIQPKQFSLSEVKTKNDFISNIDYIKNDFEEVVFNEYPELRQIKLKLQRLNPVYVSLSGSGSSVYAFFADKPNLEKMKTEFPNYEVYLC